MAVAFMVVGGVGAAILIVAMVLGDFFDGLQVFDGLQDFGGDFFSLAGVSGAIAAFGFGAAALLMFGLSVPIAIGGGVVAAIGLGALAGFLTAKLKSDAGDTSTVRRDSVVGSRGRVITDIPSDGLGVVQVTVNGHVTRLNARAEQPLTSGTPVQVDRVLTATSAMVVPTHPAEPDGPAELLD
ncbi:NfeD family protein [Naumannella halotolerans]|uniref:NfeD-like partner-binding protein n=1 Tax=Naumannella halotolerans TaxID=993414 RepID=A0A4R7JAQ6_9ACTN|nr:NfeD family protein [Naumannella halotolerans]TDT34475.1 NfeD-like partner-binding protein [Naumannella halotolerans]